MKIGIDTSLSLLSTVPNTTLSVLGDVKAWLGRYPDFVIRPTGSGGAGAMPLSVAEISALHTIGIAVAPYYNDSPLNRGVTGTAALGAQDARTAIAQAEALGFPYSQWLYCDIEANAPINMEWISGWCGAMTPSPYPGNGILYGLLEPGSSLTSAFMGTYGQFQIPANMKFWQSKWTTSGLSYQNLLKTPWDPSVTFTTQTMVMQVSGNDFNGVCDEDIMEDSFFNQGGAWLPASTITVPETPTIDVPPTIAQAVALLQQALSILQSLGG